MGWLGWLKRSNRDEDRRTREWRRSWAAAASKPDATGAGDLRAQLREIVGVAEDDDFEIEHEMLDGLDALVELSVATAQTGPPTIATGHRAVGSDRCHFSAPASLPDDPSQPSGTLLLTNTRLIFVGGARSLTVPWHSVGECVHQDRDVVLVRVDRQDLQRVRCNTFADSLCAAFLAKHLSSRRRV
jgi:hypothetical protein